MAGRADRPSPNGYHPPVDRQAHPPAPATPGSAARAPVVVCLDGERLTIDACSAGACQWLGRRPSELRDRPIGELLVAGDGPLDARLAAVADSGRPATLALRPAGADGPPLAVRVEPLLGGGGTRLLLTGRGDDDELRRQAIGELLGPLGHHLNNLFSVILGSLTLLGEEPMSDEERRAMIDDALSAGRDGAALVEKLVATAGRQVMRSTRVDVRATVARLADLIRRSLPPSIELHLRAATELPPVETDPAQLESALLELVVNAREALPEGGRVAIEIERTRHGQAGGWVSIHVIDDGTGMDAGTLAQACDPFFTTRRPRRGRGLGLGTVRGFARSCGGELHLASTPGRGTRATLRLPAAG